MVPAPAPGSRGSGGRASLGVGVTNPGTADTQQRLWWDECGQPGKAQGLALEQGLGWLAWGGRHDGVREGLAFISVLF